MADLPILHGQEFVLRYLQAPGHGATAYIKAPCHADNRGESCRLPWRGNASAAAYRRTLDRSQRDRRLLVGTGTAATSRCWELMARCMSCGTTRRVQGFGNPRPGNDCLFTSIEWVLPGLTFGALRRGRYDAWTCGRIGSGFMNPDPNHWGRAYPTGQFSRPRRQL